MRYITASGRSFHLSQYTPVEWAAIMQAALLNLGVSDEHAQRVHDDIAQAVRP